MAAWLLSRKGLAMSVRAPNKDVQKFMDELRDAFDLRFPRFNGEGHVVVTDAQGRQLTVLPSSPTDKGRWRANTVRDLKRLGAITADPKRVLAARKATAVKKRKAAEGRAPAQLRTAEIAPRVKHVVHHRFGDSPRKAAAELVLVGLEQGWALTQHRDAKPTRLKLENQWTTNISRVMAGVGSSQGTCDVLSAFCDQVLAVSPAEAESNGGVLPTTPEPSDDEREAPVTSEPVLRSDVRAVKLTDVALIQALVDMKAMLNSLGPNGVARLMQEGVLTWELWIAFAPSPSE